LLLAGSAVLVGLNAAAAVTSVAAEHRARRPGLRLVAPAGEPVLERCPQLNGSPIKPASCDPSNGRWIRLARALRFAARRSAAADRRAAVAGIRLRAGRAPCRGC
jgi:hypothetical protein